MMFVMSSTPLGGQPPAFGSPRDIWGQKNEKDKVTRSFAVQPLALSPVTRGLLPARPSASLPVT